MCFVSLTFIENPLKIYTTGIDIPRSLFKRIFFQEQVFYPYFEILSIYPSYFQVDTGPGASGGRYTSTAGVTTLLGINVEFQDRTTHLIKFQAYYSTDPENANEESLIAYNIIKNLFNRNGWKLVRNPPKLTDKEISEYEQIGNKHFSKIVHWEILVGFILIFVFLPLNLYLVLHFKLHPLFLWAILAIFVSIIPLLLFALYIHKKEIREFKKINLYMKYKAHQSDLKKG
jgi:hypothetical protein